MTEKKIPVFMVYETAYQENPILRGITYSYKEAQRMREEVANTVPTFGYTMSRSVEIYVGLSGMSHTGLMYLENYYAFRKRFMSLEEFAEHFEKLCKENEISRRCNPILHSVVVETYEP